MNKPYVLCEACQQDFEGQGKTVIVQGEVKKRCDRCGQWGNIKQCEVKG